MAQSSTQPSSVTVLKLLSGPQLGAEVRLEEGEYLIGSDDGGDVVLQDDSVAAQHVLLKIRGGSALVEIKDQAAVVGEQSLSSGQQVEVPLPGVMALGTTYVAMGAEGTDWMSLLLPDIMGQRAAHTAPAEDHQDVASNESQDAAVDDVLAELVEPTQTPGRQSSRSFVGALLLSAGMITAALLFLEFRQDLMGWLEGDSALQQAAAGPSPADEAKAIVDRLGMDQVQITTQQDGTVVLKGYCDTESAEQHLLTSMKQAGIRAESHIWSKDELMSGIEQTLGRLGAENLIHHYLGAGAISLQGYLGEDLSEEELRIILRNDVPGISRIDAKVNTLADSVTDLRQRVRDVGLGERVTVKPSGAMILAQGVLGPLQMGLWKKTAQAFAAQTHGLPPLQSRVKLKEDQVVQTAVNRSEVEDQMFEPDELEIGKPKLSVRGVVVGPDEPGFALLTNGAIVSEGDKLDGSYTIYKIEFNRIIVRNGKKEFIYYVGEG